jgi:cytochrome c oxidase subunit 3
MWLFLASLAMLFAASIIGFVVIRVRLHDVWPDDLPGLPRVLWASTALLLAGSATMHMALRAAEASSAAALRVAMAASAVLASGFLVLQAVAWSSWLASLRGVWSDSTGHRFALAGFLVLSAVHALHVVGGLVGILVVAWRSWRAGPQPLRSMGVRGCAMYWHFLDAVWLVLFATLGLGL